MTIFPNNKIFLYGNEVFKNFSSLITKNVQYKLINGNMIILYENKKQARMVN